MPALTPEFEIQYPCAGDTIDPAALEAYAQTTQDALNEVAALGVAALQPPRVLVRQVTGTDLVAGALTTATFDTEIWDTASMFTLAAPTIITLPENGSYLISVQTRVTSIPGVPVSLRMGLLIDGVEFAAKKSESGTPQGFASPIWTSVLAPSEAAGSQVTVTLLYQGTLTLRTACLISALKVSNV